jgi:hypothetical protein
MTAPGRDGGKIEKREERREKRADVDCVAGGPDEVPLRVAKLSLCVANVAPFAEKAAAWLPELALSLDRPPGSVADVGRGLE